MVKVIKFHCEWVKRESFPIEERMIESVNYWRNILTEQGLIGVLPDGTGYGNISFKYPSGKVNEKHFLITGSQTGHLPLLSSNHFALVTEYSFGRNHISCTGKIKASSESLSHAAIYEKDERVNGVIHIHSERLWNKMIHRYPTTDTSASYGTVELAHSITKIFDKESSPNIIVMGGHEDGILVSGASLEEAGKKIVELIKKIEL